MESTAKITKCSTLPRTKFGRRRKAVVWIMILSMAQQLLLPMASHAEMANPQISDSVGISLLAGLAVFIVAVGLLSRKTEAVPTAPDPNAGNITTPPADTTPSPHPAGTVAIISW